MRKGGGLTGDGLDTLTYELREIRRRLDELERPSANDRAGTLAHLAALFTVSATGANFNTGNIAGDSTFHWFDDAPVLSITLTAATGKVLLTYGCSQATIAPGDKTALAVISPVGSAPDGWSYALETTDTRLFSTNGMTIGAPLVASQPIAVPSGEPVTFSLSLGIWSSSGTTLANAQFSLPYLTAQVIN